MKALVIDDHPLIRLALSTVLEELDDDVDVDCVETAAAARDRVSADPDIDLVLLDLQLADQNGFDLLVELRASCPGLSIVVVSSSNANEDVTRAIYLGAMGFIPKRASKDVLFDALRRVVAGGIYVPPMEMRSQAAPRPPACEPGGWGLRFDAEAPSSSLGVRAPAASLGLTRRQTDVLELLLQGKSNKLIARALNLSVETIKDHVAAVLRSLNVSSRTQAVIAVSRMPQVGFQRLAVPAL